MSSTIGVPIGAIVLRGMFKNLVATAGAVGIVAASLFILERYLLAAEGRHKRDSFLRKLAAGFPADKLRMFAAAPDPVALALSQLTDDTADANENKLLRSALGVSF